MATLTKKRPAPPEEEYEMEEGPDDEDEIREGSAGRKRRSKGSMDGDCSCGKRKSKCDGSCGKTMKDGGMYKKPMMDRGDALTPQEYLAACDLGIQGQSRSYIRARLDYAERLDLKCGKGAIPEGKKCTKGPATRVEGKKAPGRIERRGLYGTSGLGGDPFSRRNMAKKGAMLNAAGGAALGALVGGGKGALIGGLAGAAGGALSGAGQAQLNRVTSRAAKRRRLTSEVTEKVGASFNKRATSIEAQRAALKDKKRTTRQAIRAERKQAYAEIKKGNWAAAESSDKRISKMKSRISGYDNKRKKLYEKLGEADLKASARLVKGYDDVIKKTKGKYGVDSIWADGFDPTDNRADLKCGKGSISPGEKCTKGAATKASGKKRSGWRGAGRAIAKGAGQAAAVGGAAMMGNAMFNFGPNANRQYARGAALMGAGSGLTKIGEGKTRAGLQDLGASAMGLGIAEGGRAFMNYRKNRNRRKLEKLYNGPSANRDSIWADGFTPEYN